MLKSWLFESSLKFKVFVMEEDMMNYSELLFWHNGVETRERERERQASWSSSQGLSVIKLLLSQQWVRLSWLQSRWTVSESADQWVSSTSRWLCTNLGVGCYTSVAPAARPLCTTRGRRRPLRLVSETRLVSKNVDHKESLSSVSMVRLHLPYFTLWDPQ